MSITIFVNYANTDKDEKLWRALKVYLAPQSTGLDRKITLWNAHENIIPGQTRKQEITSHLEAAQIFLFLLTPDYLANPECVQQMRDALARKQQEGERVQIIPILLRPCVWRGSGLDELEILPTNRVPVTRWSDQDEAWLQVYEGIQSTIDYIDNSASNGSQQPDKDGTTTRTATAGGEANMKDVNPEKEMIDVGVVIALKEEFAVLFDEIRAGAQVVRDEENNEVYYRFERKSTKGKRPYRCVVTFIGGMGPVKAALLTQKVITRWRPSTLVIPGIAGSLDSNVRIGDIVIADQVDGYLENAKAKPTEDQQGYAFALSGEVYRASNTILKLAQNFEYMHPDIFAAWQRGSAERLAQSLGEQRFGLLSDKVLHEKAQFTNGHIASGPIVGAAEAFVKWLRGRDRKYQAIEMESMGLMAAVYEQASQCDTLVLRAISDNSTKDKAKLDEIGEGALRRYAMQNAVHLLWSFLDAGLLQQK